jgi:hypothetical protein
MMSFSSILCQNELSENGLGGMLDRKSSAVRLAYAGHGIHKAAQWSERGRGLADRAGGQEEHHRCFEEGQVSL